ncbi:MAG: alpha-ribazole phosphatase [Methylobacter sp.]|nr:alpha-ribazole phosphatase [Methylobacter sp.]
MDIYLIRHTKTATGKGLCYGQSNVELADSFSEEALQLKQKLPELKPGSLVFSSPLTRCLQLAETFSNSVVSDVRLLELDFGDWEGMRFDALKPDVLLQWTDNFVHLAPPKGESFTDLCLRAENFWQDLLTYETEQVLVITHAGVIRALLTHILQLPPAKAFQFRVDFGSVHKFQHLDNYTYINYLNL